MTGSESHNSACKGRRPPKAQQQRSETSGTKVEVMAPADKLRRLAIKNSFGKNKFSPLSKALSSSTSSLHNLVPAYPLKEPAEVEEDDKLQHGLADKEQAHSRHNYSPYISRQELVHSLRRASSNHSVRLTQTICSGTSSYIYHTPRHLMPTHFNPKVARTAIVTPDSGMWSSDDVSISGEKMFDREGCDELQETQSLVGVAPSSRRGRSSPMVVPRRSKQRQQRQLYVGVEVMDSPSMKHHQGAEKADRDKGTEETSPSRIFPEHKSGVSRGMDGMLLPGYSRTVLSKNGQQHQRGVTCNQVHPSRGVHGVSTPCNHHSNHSTPSPPGSTRVSPRHLTPTGDRKIKLHIPQGRKTASLV